MINLNYDKEKMDYGNQGTHSFTIGNWTWSVGSGRIGDPVPVGALVPPTSDLLTTAPNVQTNIDGRRLKNITTSSGLTSVNFIASTDPRKDLGYYAVNSTAMALDRIEIHDGAYCKKWVLATEYFQSATTNPTNPNFQGAPAGNPAFTAGTDAKRLKLVGLVEMSCDVATPPNGGSFSSGGVMKRPVDLNGTMQYAFTYNEQNQMGRRYSLGRDALGYYNGHDENKGLIPQDVIKSGWGTANRNPDETMMQAWTLNQITYPTGGATSFIYEGHRQNSGGGLVGGIRIKSITSNDNNGGTAIVKTYQYGAGLLYSGDARPYSYILPSSNFLIQGASIGFCDVNRPSNAVNFGLTISSAPRQPMQSTQGYAIGYTSVSENYADGSSVVYSYNNTSPWTSYVTDFPQKSTQQPLGGGYLISEVKKNAAGATVASTTYNYSVDLANVTRINSRKVGISTIISTSNAYPDASGNQIIGKPWPLYTNDTLTTGWYHLDSKVVMQDGVTTTISYQYNTTSPHGSPIAVIKTNSDGRVYKNKMYYLAEIAGVSGDLNPSAVSYFQQHNMVGLPFRQENYVDGVLVGGGGVIHQLFGSPGVYYPGQIYTLNRDGSVKTVATINNYNNLGAPTQVTQAGYTTSVNSNFLNNLLISTSYGDLTTSYSYAPNSDLLTSVMDDQGITSMYAYDKLMRKQTVYGLLTDPNTANSAKAQTNYSYSFAGFAGGTSSVTTNTIFYETGGPTTLTNIGYFDGLGRPIEGLKQNYAADNANNHIIGGYTQYDNMGRPYKSYHPWETSVLASGTPASTVFYKTAQYETSPLGRTISTMSEDGHSSQAAYDMNGPFEIRRILCGNTTISGSPYSPFDIYTPASGYYAAGTLFKTTITDENNHSVYVFKDILGRTIVSRKIHNGANIDAYYIYDAQGLLAKTVPPGAMDGSGAISDLLTFEYLYDNQNRLAAKKTPGAAWQTIYYDGRDLPSLTQDGNMRAANANRYLAALYDNIGRPVETGFVTTSAPATLALALLPANINYGDDMTHTAYDIGKNRVVQTQARVLGNTDNYNDQSMITTSMTYDAWGRMTNSNANMLINNFYDIQSATYTNSGLPKTLNRKLQGVWGMNWYSNERYEYDAGLRRTNAYHQFARDGGNGCCYGSPWSVTQPEQQISNIQYDAENRTTRKNIGKATNGNWLQGVDYGYNARGWLTNINNVTEYSTGSPYLYNQRLLAMTDAIPNNWMVYDWGGRPDLAAGGKSNVDLFSENISYYETKPELNANTAQFNGNISFLQFRVAGREIQGYGMQYDDLDRLTNATYEDFHDGDWNNSAHWTTDNKFGESATYDIRGNIQSLQRNGLTQYGATTATNPYTNITKSYTTANFAQIDNLNYSYDGQNHLMAVTDNSGSAKGFAYNQKGISNGSSDYAYDANGNVIKDNNKGITSIVNNYLNLPQTVNFADGGRIEIMYDAAGNKLKKTVFPAGGMETYKYYADGVEFDNMYWAPTKFYNEEGSYSYNANSNAWNYEYSLRDHLGNTRVVFSDLNGDGAIDLNTEISQINHFYPYGMNMEGNWNGASGNYKMQFNGNEWNSDLGLNWNDHNARWYDPAIGRWGGIDPLADSYHQDSPYSFGASSPMVFADPSGMGVNDINDLSEVLISASKIPSPGALRTIGEIQSIYNYVMNLGGGLFDQTQSKPFFTTIASYYPEYDLNPRIGDKYGDNKNSVRDNLPNTATNYELYQIIGGELGREALNGHRVEKDFTYTCAIRMCHALNNSGWKITATGEGIKFGAIGRYIPSVLDLSNYLNKKSAPDVVIKGMQGSLNSADPKIAGKQGIIFFRIPYADAGGHFALWTGKNLIGGGSHGLDNFIEAIEIQLWELK